VDKPRFHLRLCDPSVFIRVICVYPRLVHCSPNSSFRGFAPRWGGSQRIWVRRERERDAMHNVHNLHNADRGIFVATPIAIDTFVHIKSINKKTAAYA